MNEMIERAAKKLWECEGERAAHANSIISSTGLSIEPFEECADSSWRPDARAALFAALDPTDRTLCVIVAMGITTDADEDDYKPRLSDARAAIAALRAQAVLSREDGEKVRDGRRPGPALEEGKDGA